MLLTFLNHQWLAFWRSKSKGGTIAVQIVMGILILYLITCAVGAGFLMGILIPKVFPGKNVIEVFNGLILYYFALEFLMRLQIQELPTLTIVPYLHLNIAKNKLVNFLNLRAVFSVFNILPLFLFFPFCLLTIGSTYGMAVSIMYMLSIFSLAIFNNYLALYVKRLSIVNLTFVIAGLVLLTGLGLLEYFKVFSISSVSNFVFTRITLHPFTGLFFPLLAIVIFQVNTRYLRKNLYLEELSPGEGKKSGTDYPFLNRFGTVGILVALEIKLILRNKRSKSIVSKGLLFLIYGFLLYKKGPLMHNEFGMILFAALFMIGNMALLYGQFMFGWQSAEFDGILTGKLSIKDFIKAKFLLFNLSSTAAMLLVSLYGLISWKILLIQFTVYFYSIGVAPVIILYMATRNYKAIDLGSGTSFNWQGVGATTMLMGLPVFLLPFVIYLPFQYLGSPYQGLIALAFFGMAGCFSRGFWVNFLVKEFNKQKYKIAEGFRDRGN